MTLPSWGRGGACACVWGEPGLQGLYEAVSVASRVARSVMRRSGAQGQVAQCPRLRFPLLDKEMVTA